MTRTDSAERYARMIDAAIARLDAAGCTGQSFDPNTGEFYDSPCLHCELLAILEQEPPA